MDPCYDDDTSAEPHRDIYGLFNAFGGNTASHSFAWTTGSVVTDSPEHPFPVDPAVLLNSIPATPDHSQWIRLNSSSTGSFPVDPAEFQPHWIVPSGSSPSSQFQPHRIIAGGSS